MIIGTNYFTSLSAAVGYYREMGFTLADVLEKGRAQEIKIGKPTIASHERLVLLDGGRRYGVEDRT